MKRFLTLFFVCFGLMIFAQVPRFTKYKVAGTEMQIYLPTAPTWDQSTAGDGSEVFVYDDFFGSINYTAIIIKISSPGLKQDPEKVLESYMIFSEDSVFYLDQKAGFGKGQTLESQPKVKGILQMGKSKSEKEYKIIGWTDGKYIAILATSSKDEMNFNLQEMFLRGIRFPQ